METCVCKYCHKMFQSPLRTMVCDECIGADNKKFEVIEQYLVDYPNSNAIQISEALEISVHDVLRYVDEGRLMISKGRFEALKDE